MEAVGAKAGTSVRSWLTRDHELVRDHVLVRNWSTLNCIKLSCSKRCSTLSCSMPVVARQIVL
jgi:hypothetical protein